MLKAGAFDQSLDIETEPSSASTSFTRHTRQRAFSIQEETIYLSAVQMYVCYIYRYIYIFNIYIYIFNIYIYLIYI